MKSTPDISPEFRAAIVKHRELMGRYGQGHPLEQQAFMIAFELSPEWFKDEAADMAREMGLMPEASGYRDDNTPMYRLDDIAAKIGVPRKEAERAFEKMIATRQAAGLRCNYQADDVGIHRRQ